MYRQAARPASDRSLTHSRMSHPMYKYLVASALLALTLGSASADEPAPPTVQALPLDGDVVRPHDHLLAVRVKQGGEELTSVAAPPTTAITVSVISAGKLQDVRVAMLPEGGSAQVEPATVRPVEVHQITRLPHPARVDGDPGWWTLGFWNANFDKVGGVTLRASLFESEPNQVSVLREFEVSLPAGTNVATIHGDLGHDYLLSIHHCTEKGCA